MVLAVAGAVVVVALKLFNWWVWSGLGPPATTPTTIDNTPITLPGVPLGVELTREGVIKLYVPRCPSTQVTSVTWFTFSELDLLWKIDRKSDDVQYFDFTAGSAPPGFATRFELKRSLKEVPRDIPLAFAVERSSGSGARLLSALAAVRLDELSPGSVYYSLPNDSVGRTAASSDEFQAAMRRYGACAMTFANQTAGRTRGPVRPR